MKLDLSCPVEIRMAIVSSEDVGTLRLLNLSGKVIASIQVSFETETGHGNQRIMDVSAMSGGRFEVSIPVLGAREGQLADATVEKVWFDDATLWRRDLNATYSYEQNLLPLGRALEELCFVAGQDAVCYPSEQGFIWVCVCGGATSAEYDTCRVCGREKEGTFAHYTQEAVESTIKKRAEEMEVLAKKALKENNEMEKARELLRKKRRRKRNTIIACILAVILAVSLYVFYDMVGQDMIKYYKAVYQLNNGDTEGAAAAFLSLGAYRDSADRAQEADYKAALALSESDEPTRILLGIERLEKIEYALAIESAAQARIKLASIYMEEGELEKAEDMLVRVSNYKQAQAIGKRVSYALALAAQEEENWVEAADRFEALEDYEDSQTYYTEAQYEAACQQMDTLSYDDALVRFAKIIPHEDSEDLTRECIYQIALNDLANDEYEAAAQKFEKLGAYRDAETMVQDSYYRQGVVYMDEGLYQQAAGLFNLAGEHLDAPELYGECVYVPAMVLMENGEFEAAAQALSAITTYSDAAEKMNEACYEHAKALQNEDNLVDALAAYRKLGQYFDAWVKADEITLDLGNTAQAEGRYEEAIGYYQQLNGTYGAATLIDECLFAQAEGLFEAGKFDEAKTIFEELGEFKSAQTRVKACDYASAMVFYDAKDYEQAYWAFSNIFNYKDAREKTEECVQLWLGTAMEAANAAMKEENYTKAIEAIGDLHGKELPPGFEDLFTLWQEANYQQARALIAADDPLKAYDYLMLVPGYKSASKLLDQTAYKLIGVWEGKENVSMHFKMDGTCIAEGDERFYSVSAYSILMGKTLDALERTYKITAIKEDSLTLTRESDGKILRLTRVEE